MPVDVDAVVVSNALLSDEYNVIALRAPEIAARVQPGQFVMVKPSPGLDPFLRRPFSVFEVLRAEHGRPSGFSLLNKHVGPGTKIIFEMRPGDRLPCLGPLGRPFDPVDPPTEAWMVAGGVGLAPFATLAAVLRARGTPMTLFYGARRSRELFCLDLFEALEVHLVLATEDGSRGISGRVTLALEQALRHHAAAAPVHLYACGPTAMMETATHLAASYGWPIDVSLEQVMGCGLGGCYSCVVPARDAHNTFHYVRSCLAGPVFRGTDIAWDALATGH